MRRAPIDLARARAMDTDRPFTESTPRPTLDRVRRAIASTRVATRDVHSRTIE